MNYDRAVKRGFSTAGLVLGGLNAIPTALCLWDSWSFSADTKGSFVAKQLPIALQLMVLYESPLRASVVSLSWVEAYCYLALPTFLGLYATGWALELYVRRRSSDLH